MYMIVSCGIFSGRRFARRNYARVFSVENVFAMQKSIVDILGEKHSLTENVHEIYLRHVVFSVVDVFLGSTVTKPI